MAKYEIETQEWYPVYVLDESSEGSFDLSAEDHADYKRVVAEFKAWQGRLRRADEAS